MSTALDAYHLENARLLNTLSDADKAIIDAEVRKRAFSFDPATAVAVHTAMLLVAREMERVTDMADWSANALEILTGNSYSTRGVRTLADFVAKVEADLVEREAEADDEYPVDAVLHADVRKWLAVSPYTVFRFRTFVIEAAADAARDASLEMLSGGDSDTSVPRAVRSSAQKWLTAWEKKGQAL